tara:strand:+ start:3045 stop:4526 length:1482 start_codon:yes stop_codon:yes gene_type:complete
LINKTFSKIKLNEIIFLVIIVICSILTPFLEFLNSNILILDYILNKSFVFLIFSVSSFLLIISSIFYLFLKKKSSFTNIILIVLTFYVFFFQHHALKFSIINNGKQYIFYAAEISFLILFTISSFLSYLIFKKKIFIKRFLYIFFIFLFSFNLLNFTKTFLDFEKDSSYSNKKIIFEDKLNLEKENIYFFILDAMGPIDKFDKYYDLNNNYFLNYAQKKNYSYFFDAKNFYESTDQNLSVIFHLDNIFDEKGVNKYNGLYPSILRSNFPDPNLISNLKNLGYQFKWVGNVFAYCFNVNLKYCLEKKNTFINPELYGAFFRKSPLVPSITRLGEIVGYDFNKNFSFKDNNGILKVKNYLIKNNFESISNKPTFYFVHHMSPHWPYITDKNCNYTSKYPGKINFEGYKEAYLCNLKRIKEMINFLEINDPNAFVVFQGDHNWEMARSIEKYGDRREIFSLIKINENCKINRTAKNNLNNLHVLKLIFECITGDKI